VAFFSFLGTLEFALFIVGVIPRDDFKTLLPGLWLDLFFGASTAGFALNTLVQVVLGFGLLRLRAWARWTVVILTIISLVIGTISSLVLSVSPVISTLLEPLISGKINVQVLGLVSLVGGAVFHVLILWPLVRPGSRLIFSQEYRAVIRETPAIRSRMHWLLKVFVGCLMMLVLGFVAYLGAIYFRIID
jgi:hypothetical protein